MQQMCLIMISQLTVQWSLTIIYLNKEKCPWGLGEGPVYKGPFYSPVHSDITQTWSRSQH